MDQFNERLGRLAELSDDEVTALEQELVAAFDAADGEGDVDTMSQIADSLDTVRAESQKRQAAAPAPDAAAPDAAAPAAAPVAASVEAESQDEIEASTDTPTTDDAVIAEAEAIVAEAAEDLAETSAETPAPEGENMDIDLNSEEVPDENKPGAEVSRIPATVIRAGGDIPGIPAGSEITEFDDVADALSSRINSLRNTTGGNGEQIVVASLQSMVEEEDHILRRGDVVGNAKKVRDARDPEALTAAANGWCAPRTPVYNIFGIGSTDRPVRDSLTSFQADRGGIVLSTPPKLSDAGYGAGLWTWYGNEWQAANDPASGTPTVDTKILYEATCPGEVTFDLEATTSQIKFNNMMSRAFPELVRRNTELALIAHARFAESRTLRAMWALTTAKVTEDNSVPLGAARDTVFTLATLATSFRGRHRMGATETMDCWAPSWLRDQVAMDLMLQTPGDSVGLSVALSEIDGYLSARNIKMNWYIDNVAGFGTNQIPQTATTVPVTAAVIMAPPGSFLYLDGGTLDIGLVRDGDLVSTNQYIEFVEEFSAVAFPGIEALGISLPVKVIGGTAITEDTTAGLVLS